MQKTTERKLSLTPALIALILILVIFGAFYLKRLKKEGNDLEQKLEQANKEKQNETLQIPLISAEDTSKAIRNEKFQLIDIREHDEFVLKHIEASINIPLSHLEEKMHILSKSKTIILIDRQDTSKGRILTQHLTEEGLDVNYLEGGILNYSNSDYDLVTIGNPLIQSDLLKVTSFTAKELIDQVMNGSRLKFVDTRPAVDYALDHLEGSINIPLEKIERKKEKLPIRTFAVFDKDPIRSFQASVRLYDMNIIGVYNCKETFQDIKNTINNLGKEEEGEEVKQEEEAKTNETK